MWKCVFLCFVLTLCLDVRGDIGDQMAEVIQKCCDDGSRFARNSTEEGCNIPTAPADIPSAFGSICVMAQAQCCKDYYKKKEDCDSGIDMALSTGACTTSKESTKVCCDECSRGSTAGLAGGSGACTARSHAASAEELLADDAYQRCCMKTAKEGAPTYTAKETTQASLCEEFAPNELCAHHCIPIPGSYKCECNPGYMLMADGKNCREVVKNRCKPRNPCQHKCNDNGVDVLCSCRRGYELMPDGKSCQDINECQLNIPVCLPGATCHNIQGSYRCIQNRVKPTGLSSASDKGRRGECPDGFARNLKNNGCDDINECKMPHPPCPAYLCENTVGGYKCGGVSGDPVNLGNQLEDDDRCPPGFTLGNHGECEDVDECAILRDDCNRLSQFCINTHSSFYCQDMVSKHCPPGFKIDAMTNRCEDINECEEDSEICRSDQICINQGGQYDCKQKPSGHRIGPHGKCPDGMRINPKTHVCEDIDECVEGTHLCDQHQRCINTEGSFDCDCKLGYELDATTGACVDINECATQQHDCISGSQRCDNTVGSFLCIRITSCGTGFILHHSTGKCEDVDECALGTHNCAIAGPEYQCMNILGSFRCVRKRVSTTTTTTAAPEYEYEYYDSEEETESNKTNSAPASVDVPSPSSPSPPPSSSSSTTEEVTPEERRGEEPRAEEPRGEEPRVEEPRIEQPRVEIPRKEEPRVEQPRVEEPRFEEPRVQEPRVEEPRIEEPRVEDRKPEDNDIIPPTYEDNRGNTPYDTRKPINYVPEVPRYIAPLYTNPPIPETTTKLQPTEPSSTPDISYYEPRPDSPNRPDIVYEQEPNSPRERPDYDNRKSISNEITPEIKPQGSKEIPQGAIEIPTPEPPIEITRPTYSPYRPKANTPPQPVLVSVGKETATVPGERKEDGSVVVDTKLVPENEWTKIDVRTNDCRRGYEPRENGACYDIDECATNQHSCSGFTELCRNTMGGYLCDCAFGFRRDLISGACVFIVTTSSTTTSTSTTTLPPLPPTSSTLPPSTTPEPVSSTSQRGRNFMGYDTQSYNSKPFWRRNRCDAGYYMNSQTGKCEDIDECTNGQTQCAAVEVCVNTQGGYRCECPPNWTLDQLRHRCVPVVNKDSFPPGYGNEPAADPQEVFGHSPKGNHYIDPEITQIEDRGTVLKCPFGYRLGDDHNCVDINECETGEHTCGRQQICTNLAGGYVCSCPRGHKTVGDRGCEDVDECALAGNMSICSRNADCINTVGSYICKCHTGFRSAPVNDKVCVDVDECSESRTGSLCQHRCSNVWGSYRCSCHRGYRLTADNRTCTDVDECVQFKSKVPCVGKCLNEPGSYRCTCPIGYRLSEDKRSCIDIDECETGEAGCQTGMYGSTSHVCFNTRGSFHCQRITCPNGYKLVSKHRCTKTERVCGFGDWECAHQPSTISYNFITFVSKLYVPEANVKLFTMLGPVQPFTQLTFQLRLTSVDAPPSVKDRADISAFLLTQTGNEAVISLIRPLEGPQSLELELVMELYSREQFGGSALAKIFIYVSEYEF